MKEEVAPRVGNTEAEGNAGMENPKASPFIEKAYTYKKVCVPERLKTDNFRFIRLIDKTKQPQDGDFTKAANLSYDDPSLLRHLEKGYNYGILGGQGGFIEIDADHEPLISLLKNKLPKTFTAKTPHGEGIHKYIEIDEPPSDSKALADTWEDKEGHRQNIGHLTSYGRQVVGVGCSVFDCPKCGAHGKDDIKGTGAKIECLKCGYKGQGSEKHYTIEDDVPIAKMKWADLNKIIGVYMVTKKSGKENDKQEKTEYVFSNEKYQNIMDVLANPDDFTEEGDGRYRGFPVFSSHQKTGYFLVYAKTNTWYSHKDEKGGYIPQLVALQEKIININEDLKGEKWWKAVKIMEDRYGITIRRDGETPRKKTKAEKHKEKVESATAETLEILHDKYQFITTKDTKKIYYYKDGVYEEAERIIEAEVEQHLGISNSRYFCNEIIGHLQREKYVDRDTINTDKTRIPLKNGLFNLDTFELEPFDKTARFTFKFPITYNAEARCPNIEAWIKEIVNEDSTDLLQEYCGYGFVPDFPMHKTLWLHGTGRNGKGAFMRLYLKLIGKNGSSVPLEQMSAGYRFALIRLKDSFCNVCSEPPSKEVFQTETFKKLTGGDEVEGEIKGVTDTVRFTSFARIFIMGNSYPQIEDNSSGFWDRMEIVKFPHSFTDTAIPSIERKKIIEDGGEEDALAGFFNWCMKGLKRLKKHEYRITQSKTSNETRLDFEKVSNSVKAFISECVTTKQGERYPQPALWNMYLEYCEDLALETQHKGDLTKAVGEIRGINLGKAKINKKTQTVWNGLVFTEYGEGEDEPIKPATEEQQQIIEVAKVAEVDKFLNHGELGENVKKEDKKIDITQLGGDGAHGNFDNFSNPKNRGLKCVCGKRFDTEAVLWGHQAKCKEFQEKQDREAGMK